MVAPVAVRHRPELEHHDVVLLHRAGARTEVLPAVGEVGTGVDRGVAAHDAGAVVAVALHADRRLDRGHDLDLGASGPRLLLEGIHPEHGDLVHGPELGELVLGLDGAHRLQRLGDVGEALGRERLAEKRLSRQRNGVRLPGERCRRERLEAALEADGATGRSRPASEVAEQALDHGSGRGPVVPDRRKRPDVPVPNGRGLVLLVLGHE